MIIGLDVSLMKGLESSEEFDFASFRPSVGFYAWGDKSSNFKIIMSASSGLSITSLDEKNHTGTMSTLEIDFIYSIYGLVFGVTSINNPVYTNNTGQVGFRIWL